MDEYTIYFGITGIGLSVMQLFSFAKWWHKAWLDGLSNSFIAMCSAVGFVPLLAIILATSFAGLIWVRDAERAGVGEYGIYARGLAAVVAGGVSCNAVIGLWFVALFWVNHLMG